jgi:hypothetical protein
MTAPPMRITEFTAVQRNSLRGFCTVVHPSGLILSDVSVHQRDGAAWASPPSKPMLDRTGQHMKDANGKTLWVPIISFASKDIRNHWSTAVIDALRRDFTRGVIMSISDDLRLTVAWFETAAPDGPAFGDPETLTWQHFASIFESRREGSKDGCGFATARFKLEPDGRQVRRLGRNVVARTAVALDIETSKETGEVPPSVDVAANRVKALGRAGVVYTSHSHHPKDNIRYRVVLPLDHEIAADLPSPEVAADLLGLLGVLDPSKINPASLFFIPSSPYGALDLHQTIVIPGAPIDSAWITRAAGALLDARQAEADRIAEQANAQAAARREANRAAGFDSNDSLIEKIRSRFDLPSVLTSHGYDKSGTKYRHPNSSSGSFGADIKVLGGIARVFSHNATDPLHAKNHPRWCGNVTALDAVDVTIILDFGGDRTRALRELAERFNLTKTAERKALAKLLFDLIKRHASQAQIEAAAFAEGERTGLSRDEICRVAIWVAGQTIPRRAA